MLKVKQQFTRPIGFISAKQCVCPGSD